MDNTKLISPRLKRAWKAMAVACRNLPLTLASLGVLTCVELFTAGGILQTTTARVDFFGVSIALAVLEIGISYGSGILAILGSGVVAELRSDPRRDHRARAGAARTVSTLLLVVPIIFFTNALAVQIQRAEREEYIASDSYRLHQQMADDPSSDSVVRLEAAANLERAREVKTARIDGAWFMSLAASIFVYGVLGWANTAFYKPRPETPWEAKERAKAEARQRKRAREIAKKKEEDRAQRGEKVVALFGRA